MVIIESLKILVSISYIYILNDDKIVVKYVIEIKLIIVFF